MATWGDPFHIVWNASAIALALLATYAIVRLPTDSFEHRWWGKAGLILVITATGAAVAGLAIPIGLLFWPAAIRRHRQVSASSSNPPSAPPPGDGPYTVGSYGSVAGKLPS
jgi:hypothetical protein